MATQKVRVRFARNVLGRRAGTIDWVEATPIVETLVRTGALRWLDAPPPSDAFLETVGIEPSVYENVVEIPETGEIITNDELWDRLAIDAESPSMTPELIAELDAFANADWPYDETGAWEAEGGSAI